jgi:hypothetical protein
MPTKQKITSSLFMALFLMPILLCGYFLWQQHSIKEEMEERLESQELTTLSILKKDVQWVKVGKELIINDEMFDVKSIKEEGEMLHIKGLYDVAEKTIKQKIALLLHQKNDANSPLGKLITQFFNPIICVENKLEVLPPLAAVITKEYFNFIETTSTCKIEITTPPPNNV